MCTFNFISDRVGHYPLFKQKRVRPLFFKEFFFSPYKNELAENFFYGAAQFIFSGIIYVTIAPLENYLLAPISNKLAQLTPEYFSWSNFEYLKQYSKEILLLTCVGYFILNVIMGPIIEELFFRGYLTSKISRFGNYAPLIITILFSLYHLWLPFNNLFRFSVFFPAAFIAWNKKNIYISTVFHCLCNLFSTVSFILTVYKL